MNRLTVILTAILVALLIAESFPANLVSRVRGRNRPERGSVTIEHVLWSVAVIAIVAIVVAAVKAYVTAQAGNIN
jgi:hypothetical protein